MVLQEANDPEVLQTESDKIVEAFRKNKIKGYGQILTFLDKYLKGGEEIVKP